MKYFILIALFTITAFYSKAQDIRFSDFYENPLVLNPANTGNFSGNWRAGNNYRQQGINTDDPYTTKTLYYEQPIYFLNEQGAGGLVYINDVSGYGMLRTNKLYASAAYFKQVSEKSYLHLGFQGGMVHKKISADKLRFPDQYDHSNGYYSSNISTAESFHTEKALYLDLNWGLVWSRLTKNLNTEAGIAMFHYNRPEETFFDNNNRLPIRWVSHLYSEIKLSEQYHLAPKALYVYQKGASELLMGTDAEYRRQTEDLFKGAYTGAYFRGGLNRHADIITVKAGAIVGNFRFSIAYDKELASAATGIYAKESFEFALIYTAPLTKITERKIPCAIF